ncbi:hypothetical protein [Flavobacterium sp. UMI-01]|uniref:hypothetical protein n=1 Tax=Flavobacterium sp. UMI-01 TaxID=1441053 RepID=UPI001C7D4B27|nr:hypothetical protein [Flavobacterium sp. UMI-01]GIZ08737.1 hypothetical protein FUMI01_14640 [Flavobacterium sp. UMI-01]
MYSKRYTPLISFSLLLILATPFESGFTFQSLTGWNMVIPSTSYLEIIVLIIVSIIAFIYWRLLKNKSKIDFKLFTLHYLLTIPIVLWARFNFPIRQFTAKNSTDIFEMIDLINRILYTVLLLFSIGQIIFAYLLFKIRKKNK